MKISAELLEKITASLLKAEVEAIAEQADRKGEFEGKTFSTEARADGTVEIRLDGVMDGGWSGASAKEIVKAMGDAKKIHMVIDSPGGLVSQGLTLYTELRSRMKKGTKVTTEGRGTVASAAVLPFLAADNEDRALVDGTMLMVHKPWGLLIAIGNEDQVEPEAKKMLDALRAHTSNYATILVDRMDKEKSEIIDTMAAETWFAVDEAIEYGFAGARAEASASEREQLYARHVEKAAEATATQILNAIGG